MGTAASSPGLEPGRAVAGPAGGGHRLVALTCRRDVMGQFANRPPLRRLAAVAALVALNLVLLASLVA